MVRSIDGHGLVRASNPPPTSMRSPNESRSSAVYPGSALVALPGLVAVTPGSGEITIAPVSVCHHVSTIGQRLPPICSRYHIHASGLIGSPTDPSRRRLERLCLAGQSSPHFMKARMAVGAVYRIVTPRRSMMSQKRSRCGQSGAPSYMMHVAPLASGPYTRYEWP